MLYEKVKNLRNKIRENQPSIGSWIQLPSIGVANLMINAGYDWLCLDLEHGEIFEQDLASLVSLIQANGIPCFVRLRSKTIHEIRKVAEIGASGVFIPNVENIDEINLTYSNMVWPPRGERGIGYGRSNLYGQNFNTELESQIDPFIIPMIESKEAVKNIDSLSKSKKADGFFIGPYDLSASLGVTGDFNNETFLNALNKIESSMQKNNSKLGIHLVNPNPQELQKKLIQASKS